VHERDGDEEAPRLGNVASLDSQNQLTEPIVAAPKQRTHFALERKASIHV
jgi:hypothetical protein